MASSSNNEDDTGAEGVTTSPGGPAGCSPVCSWAWWVLPSAVYTSGGEWDAEADGLSEAPTTERTVCDGWGNPHRFQGYQDATGFGPKGSVAVLMMWTVPPVLVPPSRTPA